jgi:hypothetical protein
VKPFPVNIQLNSVRRACSRCDFLPPQWIFPSAREYRRLVDLEMPIRSFGRVTICDLTWSERPMDGIRFQINRRCSGQFFGGGRARDFLWKSDLKLLIPAHQCNQTKSRSFANRTGVTMLPNSCCPQMATHKCEMISIKDQEIVFFSIDLESEFGFMLGTPS